MRPYYIKLLYTVITRYDVIHGLNFNHHLTPKTLTLLTPTLPLP